MRKIKKTYLWGLYSYEYQIGYAEGDTTTIKITADMSQAQITINKLLQSTVRFRDLLADVEIKVENLLKMFKNV